MADPASPAKKRKTPWGAIFWGSIGFAATFRVFYRPDRSLIKNGFVSQCAATVGCDPGMTLESFEGTQAIFAPMRGVVVAGNSSSLYIVPHDEAVLLEYAANVGEFSAQVSVGDHVGAGQQIGLAKKVKFAVFNLARTPDGHAKMGSPVEPAAWLATHGLRISSKKHKSSQLWCEGGRKIEAPQAVANCLQLPAPSGYALLPISVTTQ